MKVVGLEGFEPTAKGRLDYLFEYDKYYYMKCITCQDELKRRDQKKFCSRSCAAKHNNTAFPKRIAELIKCKSPVCDQMIKKGKSTAHCSNCISLKRHLRGNDRSEATIEEMVTRLGSNRYDQIRTHAHTLFKSQRANPLCQCCGYNKHIELCHIHPIASFSKDTKLKVVNARENILFLCPNCHWEYDNGMISLQDIESAPGRTCTDNPTIMSRLL